MHRSLLTRPVTIGVIILSTLFFGLLAVSRMAVSLLPDVEQPVLTIRTEWNGASPRLIEQRITEPLESVISSISGVESVYSVSQPGQSVVSVAFSWSTVMDLAFLNVREKLDIVRPQLPEDAGRPVLIRSGSSDQPVAILAVQSQNAHPTFEQRRDLWLWTDRVLLRRLEQLEGVAQALAVGNVEPQVEILLDPDALARQNLTLSQVSSVIERANLFTASGELQDGWYRYALKMQGQFRSLEELASLPIARSGTSSFVTLREVAQLRESAVDARSFSHLNGTPILSVIVKPAENANLVAVYEEMLPALNDLKQQFPDIEITFLQENATVISETISQLLQTLALGALLAFAVLFVFLRDPMLPFSIGISIPLSISMAFIAMYISGIELNLISLSGLTLGVGLLVDNAIVVLENIKRFREQDKPMLEAALLGTREIALPATASTLTTISVFLPLLFLGNVEGAWFREQALTLTFSLLASLFVALFILPSLAVMLSSATVRSSAIIVSLQKAYEWGLLRVLHRRWMAVALGCAGIVSVMFIVRMIPAEVLPWMETGERSYQFTLPENTSLEVTSETAQWLQQALLADSVVASSLSLGGFTDQTRPEQIARERLNRFVLLAEVPQSRQKHLIERFMEQLRRQYASWEILSLPTGLLSQFSGAAEQEGLVIRLSHTNRALVLERLPELYALWQQQLSLPVPKQTHTRSISVYELIPRQDVYLYYGLSMDDVSRQIAAQGLGHLSTRWNRDRLSQQIRLFSADEVPSSEVQSLLIRDGTRNWRLSDLFDIRKVEEPELLERVRQGNTISLAVSAGTVELMQNRERISEVLRMWTQPIGAEFSLAGSVHEGAQLLQRGYVMLGFSVLLIFLILAMQYESLVYPLLILVSVPFAWLGSLLGLVLFGLSLNLFSILGILILTGIAVNDAILKVDFMRRYFAESGDANEAAKRAGEHRFRPVVMTTLTTVLGLIPLMLPFGEALEIRQSLAIALIGGMISSTILTLYVIPGVFALVAGWKERRIEG